MMIEEMSLSRDYWRKKKDMSKSDLWAAMSRMVAKGLNRKVEESFMSEITGTEGPELPLVHNCQVVHWAPCMCVMNDHSFTACGPCLTRGIHSEVCMCNGTGLRFPGLSEICPDGLIMSYSGSDLLPTHHEKDCQCKRRGRVSMDTLEAWLDAAVSNAPGSSFLSANEEGGRILHSFMINNDFYGQGATRIDAIQEAVCRAVGAHTSRR